MAPVSNYFQTYEATNEQRVLERLVQEYIQIAGTNCYYLPKVEENVDPVLNSGSIKSFSQAIMCEMYIETVEGFTGEKDLLMPIGITIRDGVTFIISSKTFEELVTYDNTSIIRPREGDLIYFPQNNRVFTILYVDNKPNFYPLGTLPSYRVTTELFEYSNENFNTGIPAIDNIQKKFSLNQYDRALVDENGVFILSDSDNRLILIEDTPTAQEIEADNFELQDAANTIIDNAERDPFEDLEFKPRG